jgi:hypothetical protein
MALEGEGLCGDKDGLEYEMNMLVVGQEWMHASLSVVTDWT